MSIDDGDRRKSPWDATRKLARYLAQKKEELDLSGSALCDAINDATGARMSVTSFNNYVSGKQFPTESVRRCLAEYFGFSYDQFLYFLNNNVSEDQAKKWKEEGNLRELLKEKSVGERYSLYEEDIKSWEIEDQAKLLRQMITNRSQLLLLLFEHRDPESLA